MTLFWTMLIAGILGILTAEWLLWRFFCHRVEGLHLHLSSTTGRQMFTVMRIRVCVILHTILLLCTTTFSFFFVW